MCLSFSSNMTFNFCLFVSLVLWIGGITLIDENKLMKFYFKYFQDSVYVFSYVI